MYKNTDLFQNALRPSDIQPLRTVLFALMMGVAIFYGVIGFLYSNTPPTPNEDVSLIRYLSYLHIVLFGSMWLIRPLLFVKMMAQAAKVPPESAIAPIRTAFIVRAALSESLALFGGVICLLAATSGVLEAHPVYWLNMLSGFIFIWNTYQEMPDEFRLTVLYQEYVAPYCG